jgi:hypothetical protein
MHLGASFFTLRFARVMTHRSRARVMTLGGRPVSPDTEDCAMPVLVEQHNTAVAQRFLTSM